MKQFLFEVHLLSQLSDSLSAVRTCCDETAPGAVLVHVFYGETDLNQIPAAVEVIRDMLPEALIAGVTSSGEVAYGHLTDQGIVLAISVFYQTEVRICFYDCRKMTEKAAGEKLCDAVRKNPGTVAVELLLALKDGFDSASFLEQLNQCDQSIQIFGAGADVHSGTVDTRVFTDTDSAASGVVAILYAGDDFHVCTEYALGWKRLGSNMTVTKARKNILYELDGKPAFSIYEKYLQIRNDENFFNNILEFPLISNINGYDLTRVPIACGEDGSLVLGANVHEGASVSLAYGDPTAIIADVLQKQEMLRQFEPEAVFLYSCITRKSFWNYYVNKELEPFERIVPTAGFYTYGEFIRKGGMILSHNATMVATGMREGPGAGHPAPEVQPEEETVHGQMSMLLRLVNFIQATTKDLEEANGQLAEMADRDGLTKLYNRRKIEKMIRENIQKAYGEHRPVSGMLLDIDHFKRVNDRYGHETGDTVLEEVAACLQKDTGTDGIVGRWGGEEFVIMLNHADEEETVRLAEKIRSDVEKLKFDSVEKVTVSIGVITVLNEKQEENIYGRVDAALYRAKHEGRNRVCVYRDTQKAGKN